MQSLDSLRELDVKAWADQEEGCHLYCWTTNNFSNEAHKLVEHWGFQHRTIITWIKPPPFGLGSYYRNSTEQCLFATLGETTTRPAAASIPTHFEAPGGEHSEKPEKYLQHRCARSSYPPYGEANQRKARPDFTNLFVRAGKRGRGMSARARLPNRRSSAPTFAFNCGPHRYVATVLLFPGAGGLQRYLLGNGRAGSDIDPAAKNTVIVASIRFDAQARRNPYCPCVYFEALKGR